MVRAYLFLETERGKARGMAKTLAELEGVKSAHPVTGPFDVIVLAEAKTIKALGEFIVGSVQGLKGVKRTLTNIIVE
jgi:DNA-binding Lrp family transcriptional regulator